MPLTLDDILFNRRAEPYTLHNLFNFLDRNMATELLDFWVAALDIRNMFEPEHPRSSYSMNHYALDTPDEESTDIEIQEPTRSLTPSMKVKAEAVFKTKEELRKRHTDAQMLMRSTYIDDDAALCINISETLRKNIIQRCPKTPDDPPTPGLFDEAMTECERLIETNYFRQFKELADEHAKRRSQMPAPVPPPKPRNSQILKGHLLSKEEIAALVPKEPPPSDIS